MILSIYSEYYDARATRSKLYRCWQMFPASCAIKISDGLSNYIDRMICDREFIMCTAAAPIGVELNMHAEAE